MNASLIAPHHLLSGGLDRVAELGAITTVWAHPDDEAYLAAGLMAVARHLGQPVTCVTATNGDFAATEDERARIGNLRSAELEHALGTIGVDDLVTFGLRDGGCAEVDDAVGIALISAVLAARRPDTVITFGPDGLTGHPDHRAVSRWTAAAVLDVCPEARVLCPIATAFMIADDRDINDRFEVYEPGTPAVHHEDELFADLVIHGPWLDLKLAALRAHESQTSGLIGAIGEARYRRWIEREPLIAYDRY